MSWPWKKKSSEKHAVEKGDHTPATAYESGAAQIKRVCPYILLWCIILVLEFSSNHLIVTLYMMQCLIGLLILFFVAGKTGP